MNATSLNILDNLIQAFDDWTVTHAPEFSDESAVEAAESRIAEAGGVPAYAEKMIDSVSKLFEPESKSISLAGKIILAGVCEAFNDWSATSKDSVSIKEAQDWSRKRITDNGGTLAYICHHREILEAIRNQLSKNEASDIKQPDKGSAA